MIRLHPHQETMVAETRAALRKNKAVILRSPTGSGKTICAAFIVHAAIARGSEVIFTVHRRELIKQTMDAFDTCNIQYGVIAAGHRGDPLQPVQIASIDTLKRRLDTIACPDLIICDEVHHAVSAGWAEVLKRYQNAHVVGLTATPWRLDGKGLGALFGDIVHGPEVKWLIENNYLSPFRAFVPSTPDMTGVHTRAGDFAIDEIEERMDKPTITGDAVEHYKRICPQARAIAFATTVAHSMHVAECFNAQGIPALHIDGSMASGVRDEAIDRFRAGTVRVLSNCNIISEGFDVPAMETAILLRPTKSLSLYLQQVGRCMRYAPGKTAYIIDHAGNVAEHGLPTDQFDWSLTGRKKGRRGKKSEVSVKVCPNCFCAHASTDAACPACGHVYEVKEREIEEVAGQLAEIDIERHTWLKNGPYKEVVAEAQTLDDLFKIARVRGYKRAWCYKVLEERGTLNIMGAG